MKKIIKFRGKTIEGEWIYGDLVHNSINAFSKIIPIGIKPDNCYPIEVIPESVGQFTNLYDLNKKEIYEKDIMGWQSYEGKKHQTRWLVEFNPIRGYKTWSSTLNDEIILGNIIDNPELID